MTRINTNVSSLIAQKTLARSNSQLQTSLDRLSTGLRINSGKDDPAGLIASENLRRDITASEKAISNSERANQLISTADSALGQISGLLNDIRGLVTEAANTGVLSDEQIAANQLQVDSSLQAIDRIASVTTFQGRNLLDGSLDFISNTSQGASSLVDLNIQKANLGTAGTRSVSVDITSAATQAQITNTGGVNYSPGAKAAGTVTLPNVTTTEVQAAGSLNLGSGPGVVNIQAVAGGAAAGAVGNATGVTVQAADDVVQASGFVSLSNSGGVLNVSAAAGGAADGAVGNATDVVFQAAGDIAQASGTLNLSATAGTINISAVAGQAAQGANGNATTISITTGASTAASYDAGTNTLTVTVLAGDTVDDITAAIDGTAEFSATTGSNGTGTYAGADDNTNIAGTFTTGSDGTTGAAYDAGTNTLTVSAAIGATVSNLATAINSLTDFDATATFGGGNTFNTSDNGTQTDPLAGGVNGTTTATYDEGTNVITVHAAVGATVGQIATQVDGLDDFSASALVGSSNAIDSADYATTSNVLSGGVAEVTADDVITITSNETGTTFNGTLTFAANGTVAANGVDVSVTGGNISVALNNTSTYDVDDLVAAIQGQLTGYTVTRTGSAGDSSFDAASDTASTTDLVGGTVDGGTGLASDLVFKLSGQAGSEVFSFSAGTGLSDIVSSVNLLSDSTGVEASVVSGQLQLNSTSYGSKAFVDLDVVSEGTGGTFATGLNTTRDNGSDIVANVNGTRANGNGNQLSINTSALALDLTVTKGSSTDIAFTISGGGAVFQLGPDVVSNQQARIGIAAVSTASLGGSSGRLYELLAGNSKSLTNDATGAAEIVDQVISKVTGLRGRLGAFQRTTLDTNIASLNDTISNLSEAESSIRDADFAKESANLTRAQILVQSGTSVLQIANQSPQSVLSLLRG
jgi:flagellin